MIRPPPRSTRTYTLCPYTTLFRSGWQRLMEKFIESIAPMSCKIEKITLKYGYLDMKFTTKTLADEARIWRQLSHYRREFFEVCHLCGDRKSTRLNSSH